MRPFEASMAVRAEFVEALRQARGERFKLHVAEFMVFLHNEYET